MARLAPDDASALPDHHPTPAQRRYVEAWLDPAVPKTISAVCHASGVPRRTAYNWRAIPGFMAWFDHQLKLATDHLWFPILQRCAQLALQGSVEHAKLLAAIRGELTSADSPAQRGTAGVQVIIGVPRPDFARLDAPTVEVSDLVMPVHVSTEQH